MFSWLVFGLQPQVPTWSVQDARQVPYALIDEVLHELVRYARTAFQAGFLLLIAA